MSLGLSSVKVIQTVDRSAIDSIKEQIFNNAQQKAALVAKNDVMNDARTEFRQNSNPFSALSVGSTSKDSSSSSSLNYSGNKNGSRSDDDVRKLSLKHKIDLEAEMQTQSIHESIMLQARQQIGGQTDLMSKLHFLKTQTAISTYSARA